MKRFIASESPDIAIFSLTTLRCETTLKSFGSGIRTFALTKSNDRIAIVNMSGQIIIYDLVAEKGSIGKTFVGSNLIGNIKDLIPKRTCRHDKAIGCVISWNPTGSQLAIPSDEGCSYILQRNDNNSLNWTEHALVTSSNSPSTHHTRDVAMSAFSPNGKYMATVDIEGDTLIWDILPNEISSSVPIRSIPCIMPTPTALLDVQWGYDKEDNYLLLTHTTKYMIVNGVIREENGYIGPNEDVPIVHVQSPAAASSTPISQILTGSKQQNVMSVKTSESSKSMDNNTSNTSIGNRPSNGMKRIHKAGDDSVGNKSKNNDDEDDDAILNQISAEVEAMSKSVLMAGNENGNGDKYSKSSSRMGLISDDVNEDNDEGVVDDMEGGTDAYQAENLAESFVQLPLSFASTVYDEKKKRYMVWNSIGYIIQSDEGVSYKIDIKFADLQGVNKNDRFPDNYGFTLGALGYEGAAFTAPAETIANDDPTLNSVDAMIDLAYKAKHSKGSVLFYRAFPMHANLNGANETFTTTLPSAEDVTSLCVGTGFIAVTTSKSYLRIFSSTGMQLFVVWIRGPIVSLVSLNNSLCVIYNAATSMSVTSVLRADIYDIRQTSVTHIVDTSLPLSPGCTLVWSAFSTDQTLVALDSNGILSGLYHIAGWQWVPLLDTTDLQKSTEHVIWPVAVKGQNFCFITLNGESKPRVTPPPVVMTKPLKIPICEVKEGKDKDKDKAVVSVNERLREYMWNSIISDHVESTYRDHVYKGLTLPLGLNVDQYEVLMKENNTSSDQKLLRLFHAACEQNKSAQAADLMTRLKTDVGITFAIKIADNTGRTGLAKVLEDMLEERKQANMQEVVKSPYQSPLPSRTQPLSYSGRHADDEEYRNTQELDGDYDDHRDSIASASQKYSELFATENNNRDVISNKLKREPFNPFAANGFNSSTASRGSTDDSGYQVPVNKFAQSSPLSPKRKRKDIFETIKELKTSPSPKKVSFSVSNFK